MTRPVSDWGGSLLAFAIVITINVLSNTLPINGKSMTELSAVYPSLFTPAGFTFSIWGVIYVALLGFIVYQALPSQRRSALLSSISRPFQVNCAGNAAWLVLWHYEQPEIALAIMLLILATLIVIYRRLFASISSATVPQHFVLYMPFSAYTAWIVVATLANASIVQTLHGLDSWLLSPVSWVLLQLALAGAIAATIGLRLGDVIFVLVIAWASYGISVEQAANPGVAAAARMLAILALLLAIVESVKRLRRT